MVRVKVNRTSFETAMTKLNISQRELAEKTGFSKSTISHIITGRREPSPALRRVILKKLKGYKFDDLFIIEVGKNGD